MNLKVIAYVMSRIQFAVSLALCIPLLAALYWQEASVLDFLGTLLISLCLAVFLEINGSLEHESLTLREGIAITGLSWCLQTVVAAIPFFAGHYLGVIDSVFEGVSGLTCTGASVIQDLDVIPRSLILWRGIMHWIGGLGIVVIFIALFPQPGSGIMKMFEAETTGPAAERVVPRIRDTANALLMIYLFFTVVMIGMLLLCKMSLFDAVNIAFSSVATGGFATRNSSIADYNNLPAEIVIIFFMLLGSGNFGLYFIAWRKGFGRLVQNLEFRVFWLIYIVITALITINLTEAMGMDSGDSLRYAAFQMASIISTTGLSTHNFDTWPAFSQYCIILLMLMGGCAGSTSGGLKVSRIIILCKMVGKIIQEKLHPHSIARVTMSSQQQSDVVVFRVARCFMLYIVIAIVAAMFFNFDGLPVVDSIMLVLSCMGNVGVAFGVAYTFYDLPDITKVVCCFCMIIGRLEIFTFLAMLQPGFWRQNSNW